MPEEMTLQDLIEKLRADLFSPFAGTEIAGKSIYPVFFIDEVELEVAVSISYDINGQVKVTVIQVIEAGVGAGREASAAHTMRLKMTPILSREELRAEIDERTLNGIREASALALRRGAEPAGDEE